MRACMSVSMCFWHSCADIKFQSAMEKNFSVEKNIRLSTLLHHGAKEIKRRRRNILILKQRQRQHTSLSFSVNLLFTTDFLSCPPRFKYYVLRRTVPDYRIKFYLWIYVLKLYKWCKIETLKIYIFLASSYKHISAFSIKL